VSPHSLCKNDLRGIVNQKGFGGKALAAHLELKVRTLPRRFNQNVLGNRQPRLNAKRQNREALPSRKASPSFEFRTVPRISPQPYPNYSPVRNERLAKPGELVKRTKTDQVIRRLSPEKKRPQQIRTTNFHRRACLLST
jgi:hypothetical protein